MPSSPSSALPGLRPQKGHSPVTSPEPRRSPPVSPGLGAPTKRTREARREGGLGGPRAATSCWPCLTPSPASTTPSVFPPYPAWLHCPHQARPRGREGMSPRKCERWQQDCPLWGKVTQGPGPGPAPHYTPPSSFFFVNMTYTQLNKQPFWPSSRVSVPVCLCPQRSLCHHGVGGGGVTNSRVPIKSSGWKSSMFSPAPRVSLLPRCPDLQAVKEKLTGRVGAGLLRI